MHVLYQCVRFTHTYYLVSASSHTPVRINKSYLFVPLQQGSTAVFRRLLKALVDVLHEQVNSVLIQRLYSFLNVTALEGTQYFKHQGFSTILITHTVKEVHAFTCLKLKVYFEEQASFVSHGTVNARHGSIVL